MNKQYTFVPRSKVGKSDVSLTPPILAAVRQKMADMVSLPVGEAARRLQAEYKVSTHTIEGWIRAARVHDDIFKLYLDGKISFTVLDDVSSLDPETGLFLVTEMISRGLLPSQLRKAISFHRQKVVNSWDAALNMAAGKVETQVPPPPPSRRGPTRLRSSSDATDFDGLLRDIIAGGTEWRLKVKAVIEMLPLTASQAEHSFATFTKLFMLRDTLQEQYEFVDRTVKSVLDRMLGKASVEADMKEVPCDEASGDGRADTGTEVGGGEGSEVHGDGQAVPHPPRAKDGEERVR